MTHLFNGRGKSLLQTILKPRTPLPSVLQLHGQTPPPFWKRQAPRCCSNVSVLQREQLLMLWSIFSSFSSVSSNDYNQVFFLILQWAKEQHIVQRVSPWGALCWMVSNTWGSGLQVGLLILSSGLPRDVSPAPPASSIRPLSCRV